MFSCWVVCIPAQQPLGPIRSCDRCVYVMVTKQTMISIRRIIITYNSDNGQYIRYVQCLRLTRKLEFTDIH